MFVDDVTHQTLWMMSLAKRPGEDLLLTNSTIYILLLSEITWCRLEREFWQGPFHCGQLVKVSSVLKGLKH